MTGSNSRVDAFLAEATAWREEMTALRAILLDGPLAEDFKWRAPCYTYGGGNVVALWGLKEYCALAFFKGVLLKDGAGLLVAPGENSRSMRSMRFTGTAEIAATEAVIRDYIREAAEAEKAGLKVEFRNDDLAWPAELTEALEADPQLKAAFEALTPGRRRGYVLHFSQPKKAETRTSRIAKCAPRILEGKGLHDR